MWTWRMWAWRGAASMAASCKGATAKVKTQTIAVVGEDVEKLMDMLDSVRKIVGGGISHAQTEDGARASWQE